MKYEINNILKKKYEYCVLIFCINEGKRLHSQIKKISKLNILADIVIVDGGSTDNTIDENLFLDSNISTVLIKKSYGYLGTQMRIGFDWAIKNDYKGIIVMDGNDKDDPKDINSFINKLKQGFDHIQGSRFVTNGFHQNTPLIRILAIKYIHSIILNFFSKFKYTDTTNGFRGYSNK